MHHTLEWKIKEVESGQFLRDYLLHIKKISRKALADIKFHGGEIKVNGESVTVRYILRTDDHVSIAFPPEKVSDWIRPHAVPLNIVYEDSHLLVVNKPPQLPTIPSRDHLEGSLAGAVIYYYQENNIPFTFHAVNRLDKDTSGLMMIAKHRYAHDLFVRMQKEKGIQRSYTAIIHGELSKHSGTVNEPIGRREGSIIEREVRTDGQMAITHYQVKETLGNASLVELILDTGRTHQIRVHMSYIGHPLMGDTLYGGKKEIIERQALHSSSIRFFHPIENREFFFESSIPNDMEEALKALRD
ncbi:RluA family pseudouridine synthase [Evansella tamaricis]|uniref:Pseudouridine synthase n=1 Tax=Evansella tamaricis TaxID=2069301 RepID=A0ABS6JLU8_9BACI|nr:RluA family pseudouridine synthase [Evansella tamaricis]MBU9713288.1 RluA family pseudouridine synthase [Evansella tamaricis]